MRIQEEILSGPAAFPGFNLRSCLDTPETDIVMICIDGIGYLICWLCQLEVCNLCH